MLRTEQYPSHSPPTHPPKRLGKTENMEVSYIANVCKPLYGERNI